MARILAPECRALYAGAKAGNNAATMHGTHDFF
jgi:hypothetical protein